MYTFTDMTIAKKLIDKRRTGVKVHICVDRAAYEKEVKALCGPGCVLRELHAGDSEMGAARERATQCRFLLEFKRAGIWKVRMQVSVNFQNDFAVFLVKLGTVFATF